MPIDKAAIKKTPTLSGSLGQMPSEALGAEESSVHGSESLQAARPLSAWWLRAGQTPAPIAGAHSAADLPADQPRGLFSVVFSGLERD